MKVYQIPTAVQKLFDWYHSGKPFTEFEILIGDTHSRIRKMLIDSGVMFQDGSASADWSFDLIVYSILLYLTLGQTPKVLKS